MTLERVCVRIVIAVSSFFSTSLRTVKGFGAPFGRLLGKRGSSAPSQVFEAPREAQENRYFKLSPEACTLLAARVASLSRRPLLSFVVPTYNTPEAFLRACLLSVLNQSYDEIELIIVDDCSSRTHTADLAREITNGDLRVKLIQRSSNGGISQATNDAVAAATGEFILFVDHDDELMPTAALSFAENILASPDNDAWYSDQEKCDEYGNVIDHFHKPDWSPIYMLGVMFVGHLLGVRSGLVKELMFDSNFDGVQDFEFMLRLTERTGRIGHIPEVLYKWRSIPGSLASGSNEKAGVDDAQRRATQAHLSRLGRTWRVKSHLRSAHRLTIHASAETSEPKVSIIIPSRNQGEIISRCLDSIFAMTDYNDFEVIIVDNCTTDPVARRAFSRYPLKRIVFNSPFNYSRANNAGVDVSNGELLLFLNNDTEILTCNWLRDLVLYFEDKRIGAVGPTLLYPDRTVQHAGVVLGARGTADHAMRYFAEHWDGYSGSLTCSREVSAVTAACLMMPRHLFDRVGRFSTDYAKHYQDVDLCLKVRDQGLSIIATGHPRLMHHESASRKSDGYDLGDRAILIDRWYEKLVSGDPFYNGALDRHKLDYSAAS